MDTITDTDTFKDERLKVERLKASILAAYPLAYEQDSRIDMSNVTGAPCARDNADSPTPLATIDSRQYSSQWCLDFFTMAGRKSENQDSLLMMTCLPYQSLRSKWTGINLDTLPAPLLVLIADGVSACQFPKQASQMVVDTMAEKVSKALVQLAHSQYESLMETHQEKCDTAKVAVSAAAIRAAIGFEDNQIASIIKTAVNKTNDLLCFPQAYQRVPPLLSTLSGLICIGDRIHLFHTGDSRIYRVGGDSLITLSRDHRIHRGQDKGALSAAIGADVRVDVQQSVFTLHQEECLVLMTDGVYEHIDATELQFELCRRAFNAAQFLATPQTLPSEFAICQTLCEHAFNEGSADNLSMMFLRMNAVLAHSDALTEHPHDAKDSRNTSHIIEQPDATDVTRYKLPTGLVVGDSLDGFEVIAIIARTARSDVYLVHDEYNHEYVLKSPSLDTVDDGHYLRDFLKERKIGLSLSKHRRAGESAFNQADPNNLPENASHASTLPPIGSGLSASGLLRYYPVPASSTYLYHLTEYIEGESLREFITRNAPFDIWQTYDLLTKIGMAVRVMHRNYLLHQDIKPENVLLTKAGAVKLIDFGSAGSMILQDSTRPPNGDLHYAAPEYYTDAPKGVHSDLFSIAVIGYELLTGQLPFSPQDLMRPKHALSVPTQPLRQHKVPEASQQALMRALHSNTNARHQAIGEFLQDFNPDNKAYRREPEPLIIRNPLLVWQSVCAVQAVIIVYVLWLFLS